MKTVQNDWRRVRLGEIALVRDGSHVTPGYLKEGVPFLRVCDIGGKEVDLTSVKRISTQEYELMTKSIRPQRGDVLLSKNGTVGVPKVVDWDWPFACFVSLALLRIKNPEMLSPQYLCEVLKSSLVQRQIGLRSKAGTVTNLHLEEIKEIQIPLPHAEQQAALMACAGEWQRGINLCEALSDAAEQRKRGLMQQLLTGQKRFKEFNGQRWPTFRLGELLQEVDRYVTFDDEHNYKLASIRRRSEGLFFREALQGKDIKTKVMKTIRSGDFLLSKMQVVHGAWGLVTPEFDGMFVSDSYIALVPREGSALKIEFLNYLSRMRFMRHLAYISSHGVHIEKMTFNLDDFLHEKITIPPTVEEQAKIVDVLSACDREIELLQKQLEALKEQKRGLMQMLLTGKVRVKVGDTAECGMRSADLPRTGATSGKD
jgi:type I restriction enzyme, S subunit